MRLRAIATALLTVLASTATLVGTAGSASATGPSMSISFSVSSASYGGGVYVTAALGSATHDRTLKIYAEGSTGGPRLVRSGTVNSSGKLVAGVRVYQNLTFYAVFDGDDVYDAREVSRALPVHARLVMASSSTTHSGAYHTFKAGTEPAVKMRVDDPNPGRCVAAVAQQYYNRAWHTFGSRTCLPLDSTSHTGVRLLGTYRAGTRVRVVGYFRGGSVNSYSAHVAYYILFVR